MRTRVDVSRRILGGKRECLLPGPHDLPRAWPRIALDGRTSWFRRAPANGRLRRVSPVAAHTGDRLLPEPTAGTQPCRREPLFTHHYGLCPGRTHGSAGCPKPSLGVEAP